MKQLIRKVRRWSKRKELLAVADDHLDEWLDTIGLLSPINHGEVTCHVCKVPIDKENLHMVSRLQGELIVICDNLDCTRHFLAVREGQS